MGLGSILSSLGSGIKKGSGLFDTLKPGEPGLSSSVPGTGGKAPVGAMGTVIDPDDVLGLRSGAVAPDAAKKPGWWARQNAINPETGLSNVDKFGKFGSDLMTIWDDDGGGGAAGAPAGTDYDGLAKSRLASMERTKLNAAFDQQYGADPELALLARVDPGKFAENRLKNREPIKMGGDDRLMTAAGEVIAGQAPKYGVQNDSLFNERTGEVGPRLPMSYENTIAQRRLEELDKPYHEGMLGVARQNAGTSAFSARSADARGWASERRQGAAAAAAPGAQTGSLSGMSTAQLLQMLKGGR